MTITFITWDQKKADYLAKYLGFPVEHVKLDFDELQSLDLREIVEHKGLLINNIAGFRANALQIHCLRLREIVRRSCATMNNFPIE